MTVAELIEQLSKLNPSAEVRIEGCDCINPAKRATFVDAIVLIEADLS